MMVSSTHRITVVHYTYGSATLSAGYSCKLYVHNYRHTVLSWVYSLKWCLCLLGLLTESDGYNTLMGAPPYVQPGSATLSAAYIAYSLLQNHWVSLHQWVSNLNSSLCWLALPLESKCYTLLMGVQP